MPGQSMQQDEMKRRIRNLKKLETKIRFSSIGLAEKPSAAGLVWDTFFDLHEESTGKAKYSIAQLSAMDKDEYRNVVDEFFFMVYVTFYKENGLETIDLYDPKILSQLGLPFDADNTAIKKRFRELAMKFHPDTGGDATRFIELMGNYKKLIDKGK